MVLFYYKYETDKYRIEKEKYMDNKNFQIEGMKIQLPVDAENMKEYDIIYIIDQRHGFILDCPDPYNQYYHEYWGRRELIQEKTLFGVDKNNIPFTLVDCEIELSGIPTHKMKISWNRILYGLHTKKDMELTCTIAEYTLRLSKYIPYRRIIWLDEYILIPDILIATVRLRDKYNEEYSVIKLTCKDSITVREMDIYLIRFLEIQYLLSGYFPDVIEQKYSLDNNKCAEGIKQISGYINATVRNTGFLYSISLKACTDFSVIYRKWIERRKKVVIQFNMFAYTSESRDYVDEVPIATYIQCLEGYMDIVHGKKLKRYDKKAINDITDILCLTAENVPMIEEICCNSGIDKEELSGRVKALLGNLTRLDLKGKLEYAVNLSPDISRIFKYEKEHVDEKGNSLYDVFIRKAHVHRNWLSHMFENKSPQHFSGTEIDLASRKLKFLFRLLLLYDINVDLVDGDVDRVCRNIDKWYEKNKLF